MTRDHYAKLMAVYIFLNKPGAGNKELARALLSEILQLTPAAERELEKMAKEKPAKK